MSDAHRGPVAALDHLGDFTTTTRVLPIAALAAVIGVVAAYVAAGLLALIGFFTNLFFFQRAGTALVSPAGHHLGPFVIAVPVIGALVIGLMARYGSERIRGHGIPEAIEAILINGSRVEPKVALLKPLSSAISIGSGGPFGAEGPIIMTGGAFGSLVAQFFHLTSAERKTLLVAGAAAGMSATFAAPLASVVLAVELLLFEWKPRSLIPVALASVAPRRCAGTSSGSARVFPVPVASPRSSAPAACSAASSSALLAGALSALLTGAVYASEDAFAHLPIHWMWWPAIGGLVIGIGGFFFPQALGVGYDVIGGLLQGDTPLPDHRRRAGGEVGHLGDFARVGHLGRRPRAAADDGRRARRARGRFLPVRGAGFWPLVSMGAILGGTMRSPLTGVIFALELTHDVNMLLPLLLAVIVAHGFTVLTLRRSILTEKISRRGFHLSREYSIDPLEIIFAREVARGVVALPADATRREVTAVLAGPRPAPERQARPGCGAVAARTAAVPLVDSDRRLAGVVTRSALRGWLDGGAPAPGTPDGVVLGRCRAQQSGHGVRRRAAAHARVPDGRNGRDAHPDRGAPRRRAARDGRAERPADRARTHPRGGAAP